jgi:hypothetical protein
MMIAFEVIVNGSKLCDAGVEGLGVLTAILSWAHRVPELEVESNRQYPPDELLLEVGGLQSARDDKPRRHLSWLSKHLQVGDAIVINIKSLEAVDPPEKLIPEGPTEVVREAKRRAYEELRKEFGE